MVRISDPSQDHVCTVHWLRICTLFNSIIIFYFFILFLQLRYIHITYNVSHVKKFISQNFKNFILLLYKFLFSSF
jgi:hypothetical protein